MLLTSRLGKTYLRARLRTRLWLIRPRETWRDPRWKMPHIFVALAADYGNLGDLAITEAQVAFLKERFPNARVVRVPISQSLGAIKGLRAQVEPGDWIALVGGGNTGDHYDDIEYLRELWIANFPDQLIVSFPQTVRFRSSRAARRAAAVFNSHTQLAFLARDSTSLAEIRDLFPRMLVAAAPDVVLTLDQRHPVAERRGVLMALRSDEEQGSRTFREEVLAAFADSERRYRDTHIGDVRLDPTMARRALESIWAEFRSAELVVTDRLHGMIFAVITGTPCLALDSATGKVGQFYRDWLEPHPRVRLLQGNEKRESIKDASTQVRVGDSRSHHLTRLQELFESRFDDLVGSEVSRS